MNGDWRALGLADLDALWEAAKAAESKRRAGAANAAD
jgi:hypothetical protein